MARKKRVTKEMILEVAGEILKTDGVAGLDMRSIASRLDIAVGTLYNYYKSQEALIMDLFHFSWMKTKDRIESEGVLSVCGFEKYSFLVKILHEDVRDRKGIGGYIAGNLNKFNLEWNNDKDHLLHEVLKQYTDMALEEYYLEKDISSDYLNLEKEMLYIATLHSVKTDSKNEKLFLQVVEDKFFKN